MSTKVNPFTVEKTMSLPVKEPEKKERKPRAKKAEATPAPAPKPKRGKKNVLEEIPKSEDPKAEPPAKVKKPRKPPSEKQLEVLKRGQEALRKLREEKKKAQQ